MEAEGVGLEERETARAGGEEVAPLHEDEGEEVDGLGDIDRLGVGVEVVCVGKTSISQNTTCQLGPLRRRMQKEKESLQVAEQEALTVEVPEGHGHSAQTLQDTQEEVGVEEELPVDQSIRLGISRLAEKETGLGLLKAHGDGGEDVGDDANDNHLDG